MQLTYRFYLGGDSNPYEEEERKAYGKLTEEREAVDPGKEKPIAVLFPQLDSWADYLIAHSKSVFWQMERAIRKGDPSKADEIEEIWDEAKSSGSVGEWLKVAEADEAEKAMCYYLSLLHREFDPKGFSVDFRYYITEGKWTSRDGGGETFSLEAYE